MLAEGFVQSSPLRWTHDALLGWVDSIASDWSQSIPWAKLDLFEEEKARSGSAATLIGLQLAPPSQQATTGTWQCLALGDSCLFQVSDDHLVRALPLKRSTDFNVRPSLLSTQRNINVQSIGKLVAEDGTWQNGDRFFLLTDAIAQWFLRQFEYGEAPWNFLSSLDEQPFTTFVQDAQAQGLMRNDDVTAFMIGIGVPLATGRLPVTTPVPSGPQPPPSPIPPAPISARPVPVESGGARERRDPAPSRRPAPPGHPQQAPAPPRGPSRGARLRRRRVALLTTAFVVLVAAIAVVLSSVISNPPRKPTPAVPPPPPVQPAARNFAELLATYPGGGKTAFAAYESALSNSVVGRNVAVVSQLLGRDQAPPDSLSSRANAVSVAVVNSTQSQAELYVVVRQVITAPYTYTTSRTCTTRRNSQPHTCIVSHTVTGQTSRLLLINLTMARQGQKWLVSTGHVSLLTSPAGTLTGGNR